MFDFKYVPDFHITTEAGESNHVGIKEHGIERRNLKALLIGLTCTGVGIYAGVYIASSIFERISNFWSLR